jgi:hypothetical protein
MKINLLSLSLILVMVFLPMILGAQSNGGNESSDREPPIEELYLKNPELQIINEEATSNDREAKLRAITRVEKTLKEGTSTDEEYTIALILGHLAGEGTTTLHSEQGRLINYFPEVRGQACNALQFVKSDKAKAKAVNILIGVLINDIDPIVKSNAAYALGEIGLNEDERAAKALAEAVEIQDIMAPNDNFAYVAALAFEKIAKANDGIYEPRAYRALVKIAQGNYSKVVKDKALEVLEELKQYSK